MTHAYGSTVTTHDGKIGTVIRMPAGSSAYFQTYAGENESEHVAVVPVLMESGEVRFFTEAAFA